MTIARIEDVAALATAFGQDVGRVDADVSLLGARPERFGSAGDDSASLQAAFSAAVANGSRSVYLSRDYVSTIAPPAGVRRLGSGKIVVNGRDQEVYFARPTLRLVINQPFGITDRVGQYDIIATVKGGGLSGQAGAVLHGIAQALTRYEPVLRTTVKRAGFLTRDPRVVERKKYGRAKARRSFQFSKR